MPVANRKRVTRVGWRSPSLREGSLMMVPVGFSAETFGISGSKAACTAKQRDARVRQCSSGSPAEWLSSRLVSVWHLSDALLDGLRLSLISLGHNTDAKRDWPAPNRPARPSQPESMHTRDPVPKCQVIVPTGQAGALVMDQDGHVGDPGEREDWLASLLLSRQEIPPGPQPRRVRFRPPRCGDRLSHDDLRGP